MASKFGDRLRQARLAEGLNQGELAAKMKVAQPTISTWETGAIKPGNAQLARLQEILGNLATSDTGQTKSEAAVPAQNNPFGVWLRKERSAIGLSVPELAKASKVSAVAIYNIESGRSQNPQSETKTRLETALGKKIPEDIKTEIAEEQRIEGLGPLTDFDPHDVSSLPSVGGVYVFYDISERPIYIGKAANIADRVKSHSEKFWFRSPIVFNGSYVQISNADVRHQVEQVLIKFLKSNAVINKQSVDR